MLAALWEAVWSELVVVGSVECVIDGTSICALDDAVSLFHFQVDIMDTEVSTVAADMIYRSLTRLPVIVINDDDLDHLPCSHVDVYPAVSI